VTRVQQWPVGALRCAYDHQMADEFLQESAHPPVTAVDRVAWRKRWGPWLSGRAPGPIGPRLRWHRMDHRVEMDW
jgi:hypothetical protein